jgi:uncharacterized protein (TIGR03086 family)
MDVTDLESATSVVVTVLRGIGPDQWEAPTPCPDWTVRQLVRHLVVGTDRFMTRLGHTGTTLVPGEDAGPAELLAALEASSAELVDLFRQPGVLQRVMELPIGAMPGQNGLDLRVVETVTHGWDLSQALSTPFPFEAHIVEQALAWSGPALERIPEGRSPFGTPQPASEGADALDRLAALLGRQPVQSI